MAQTPRCPRQMGIHINHLLGSVPSTLNPLYVFRMFSVFGYGMRFLASTTLSFRLRSVKPDASCGVPKPRCTSLLSPPAPRVHALRPAFTRSRRALRNAIHSSRPKAAGVGGPRHHLRPVAQEVPQDVGDTVTGSGGPTWRGDETRDRCGG